MDYQNARRICFLLAALLIGCIVIGIITRRAFILIPIIILAGAIGFIMNKYFRCPGCGKRIPDRLNYKPYKMCIFCGKNLSGKNLMR